MAIERYSVGIPIPGPIGAGRAYAELLASAGSPVSVKKIEVVSSSNVGGEIALVHSYAIGTGHATGIFTGCAHRTIATLPTGPARVQIAWVNTGGAPSGGTPTGYGRLLQHLLLPVATGQVRTLWDSSVQGDLVIEPNMSILVLNHASGIQGGGAHINFTWEEGRR